MTKAWQVAWRDITHHLRKRDFYFATFTIPVLLLVLSLGARLLGGSRDGGVSALFTSATQHAGLVDPQHVIQVPLSTITTTSFISYTTPQAAEIALRSGEIDAFFTLPPDYLATGAITMTARTARITTGQDFTDLRTLLSASLLRSEDIGLARRLHQPVMSVQQHQVAATARFSGDLVDDFKSALTPIVFALAIYGAIFMSASLLMQGIIEEKENRTLEILLTSITPRQLLLGKIIGLGALGLLQLLIWAAIGALSLNTSMLNAANTLPLSVWLLAFVLFMLGFLFYASLMAGIGAISPSMRELSQLTLLITIPALVPLAMLPIILGRPNGTLAVTLTMIPFTAPATLMLRQGIAAVPTWQMGLSMAILAASTWLTLRITARLFHASILLIGTKLTLRGAWRLLR